MKGSTKSVIASPDPAHTRFLSVLYSHLKRKRRGSYFIQEPVIRYLLIGLLALALYVPIDILDQ